MTEIDRAKANMQSLKTYVTDPLNATQKYFDTTGFKDAAIALELAATNVFGGSKEHPQRSLMAQIAILDDIFINLSTMAAKADTHSKRMELLDKAFKAQAQSSQALATLLNSQKSDVRLIQNNFYDNK